LYILWSFFGLAVFVDSSYRTLIGLTPQLGRMGAEPQSIASGLQFAAISSLIVFQVLSMFYFPFLFFIFIIFSFL